MYLIALHLYIEKHSPMEKCASIAEGSAKFLPEQQANLENAIDVQEMPDKEVEVRGLANRLPKTCKDVVKQ